MRVESPFGTGKPSASVGINRVIASNEMPFKTEPLTYDQKITAEMQKIGDESDLHQRRAEALTKEKLTFT